MWMTYIDMQAVSTMLNQNSNILTIGIPPVANLMCARCKPSKSFRAEEDLIEHTKITYMTGWRQRRKRRGEFREQGGQR